MKPSLYEKMESWFHLIRHNFKPISQLELTLYQLARGNAFDMRVVGLEGIKRFRLGHPNCAITFKPNHFSEADFILLSLLFRENDLRVLTEGGANLFIEDIDLFQDLLPAAVNRGLASELRNEKLSIAQYLTDRGSFKVFRESVTVKLEDGQETKLTQKDILSLTRAYRYHLVQQKEMYTTFPGYSTIKAGLLNLLKKSEVKTGRSYSGKIDGFHHLPFQMDIEAALYAETDVYIVDVNLAYERVMEDENFAELSRLHDAGEDKKKIYMQDLGYIVRQFCAPRHKVNLSIKFGEPVKVDTGALKDPFQGRKIKNAAHQHATKSYENVMAMQPIFPANIYFSAFGEDLARMPAHELKENIEAIRHRLPTLAWGKKKQRVDLHYLEGYDSQIISTPEIINQTLRLFGPPDHRITSLDGDLFGVYNKDVARQYRNHTAHFFEEKP